MSERLVSILVTATARDAMAALICLRDLEGPLPVTLATFAISLEFAAGRSSILDVLEETGVPPDDPDLGEEPS